MSVKIIADSTCDLPEELRKKHDIDTVPLHVILNGETFRDGIDIKPKEIIDWSNKTGAIPKTAAPNIEAFKKVIGKYSDEGRDIVLVAVAHEFSGTFQNALIAKEDFDNVDIRVVDSRNLSTGMGLLALEAAELAQEGLSAEEIESRLLETIPKIKTSFFVNTLTFLRRGGRCSAIQAFGANSLKIKPQIVVDNGTMKTGSKFRGKIMKVCEAYTNTVLENLDKINPKRVFITHSPTDTGIVQLAYDIVKAKNYFNEIIIGHTGCIITSHCGASTLGVMYIEK